MIKTFKNLNKFIIISTTTFSIMWMYNKNIYKGKENFIPKKGTAFIVGDNGVKGKVDFFQLEENSGTTLEGEIKGLSPGKHGFHIHEFGDISEGCLTAGPHYNPLNKSHGGINEKERHIGDLGNIEANKEGVAKFKFIENDLRLVGEYGVVGRTLVIHQNEDDLGKGNFEDSKTTGHSGARIGCGVIGIKK